MSFKKSILTFRQRVLFLLAVLPIFAFSQDTSQLALHQNDLDITKYPDSPTDIINYYNSDIQTDQADWVAVTGKTNPVSCAGGNDGNATVETSGRGTFSYRWDEAAGHQTRATATHLSAGSYEVTVTEASGYTQVVKVSVTEPAPLQINAQNIVAPLHANQHNGSFSVMVEGGVGTYNYEWSNSALPNSPVLEQLSAGTYELTVTDARGCTSTFGLTLLEPLH